MWRWLMVVGVVASGCGDAPGDAPAADWGVVRIVIGFDLGQINELRTGVELSDCAASAAFDGEAMAAELEDWRTALCDPEVYPETVDCSLLSLEPSYDDDGDPWLSVRYAVEGDYVDREFVIGPLPTRAQAGCTPEVYWWFMGWTDDDYSHGLGSRFPETLVTDGPPLVLE